MSTICLIKRDYELFEIHTMPRSVVCITCVANKSSSHRIYNGMYYYKVTVPKGAYGISIQMDEKLPEFCSFYPVTKSIRTIHKRIDAIRDALEHTDLKLFIDDKEIPLYTMGFRHKVKGLYVGIEVDSNGKYHKFMKNGKPFKEYINEYKI